MKRYNLVHVFLLLALAVGLVSSSLRAEEDGRGTNVVRNLRVTPAGTLSLGGTAITNWTLMPLGTGAVSLADYLATNAVVQGATNALNTSVTSLTYQVTNDYYNATNALNTSVTSLTYQVTNDYYNATNALNTAVNLLNTKTSRWDNAVVIRVGAAGDEVAAIVYSNLYYYAEGNTWSNACATNSTRAGGLLGLALGPDPATDGLLLNGQCTGSWNFTAGQILYMSTNSNQITPTMPTTANHFVRIVGYAVSASIIYFNPDRTYIQILGE